MVASAWRWCDSWRARRCAVALSSMRPRCKSCFAHGQCHQVSAVSVVRDVRACACSFHKQGPPNGVLSEDAMDNLSRSKSANQWNQWSRWHSCNAGTSSSSMPRSRLSPLRLTTTGCVQSFLLSSALESSLIFGDVFCKLCWFVQDEV